MLRRAGAQVVVADNGATCLGAGCDDYATKPIGRKALIKLLTRHLTPVTAGSP